MFQVPHRTDCIYHTAVTISTIYVPSALKVLMFGATQMCITFEAQSVRHNYMQRHSTCKSWAVPHRCASLCIKAQSVRYNYMQRHSTCKSWVVPHRCHHIVLKLRVLDKTICSVIQHVRVGRCHTDVHHIVLKPRVLDITICSVIQHVRVGPLKLFPCYTQKHSKHPTIF